MMPFALGDAPAACLWKLPRTAREGQEKTGQKKAGSMRTGMSDLRKNDSQKLF